MQPTGLRPSLRTRAREYLRTEVREDIWLEAEMLLLAFATGIGDATTYSEYRVFTANHTGNTILLAVGVTEQSSQVTDTYKIPIPLKLISISLSMFILGSWIPGQIGHRVGCRRRWWLLLNNFFQMLLVLTASMLQARYFGWNALPRTGPIDMTSVSMGVVALLALSAGGQVAVARALHMTEITTANATSAYVDLLIDKRLFQIENRNRNRRLCFLTSLLVGSFAGGFAYQKLGSSRTLFASAVGKTVVTIMMLFNKGGLFSKGCLFNRRCVCSRAGIIQSDYDSASDLIYTSGTEKECAKCVSSRVTGVLSEKPKDTEFDYRGTQSPTRYDGAGSRNSMLYSMGTYLDFTPSQLFIHIPSWTITSGTTGYRQVPGR